MEALLNWVSISYAFASIVLIAASLLWAMEELKTNNMKLVIKLASIAPLFPLVVALWAWWPERKR